jgi:hypothetical protein
MAKLEHATTGLRFVKRGELYHLQQQWLVWDEKQVASYEWRDVPAVEEDKNESTA